MQIIAAADLHLSPSNFSRLTDMAAQSARSDADVLIIAGDLTTGPLSQHGEILQALSAFPGLKLFVPGNHDLWQKVRERNTWQRYEIELPQVVAAAGFHYLAQAPVVHNGYGFVGCLGWYDYSLRQTEPPDADLRLSPATVTRPGGTLHRDPHRHDLAWGDLLPEDYATKAMQCLDDNVAQGLVWNDRFYVDWGKTDEEMVEYCCEKLRQQAASIAAEVDHVIAVTHFVPFAEVLPNARTVTAAYARAFAGSTRLGDTIRALPKISAAIFGHWHRQQTWDLDGLLAANASVDHAQQPPLKLQLP